MENKFGAETPRKNYEDFLEITLCDMTASDKHSQTRLKFSVTSIFKIFISPESHEHVAKAYGVNLDDSLTEGDIFFDEAGKIKKVQFKYHPYQPIPGFDGTAEDLAQLQKDVEKIIRKNFE
ncbi:MAG: hypothetical protein WCV69_03700 [Patescibacteria group bacterium]|jgi:hypothetical protein